MAENTREGLVWERSGLSLEPRLKSEPSLDAIKKVCLRALQLEGSDAIVVSFLAAGALNKLYFVELKEGRRLVMRVPLPVDPGHKTVGEVTTLRWLRRHSNVPIPEVIAFDSTRNNEIGLEWILMNFVSGISAHCMWRKMTMESKIALVKKIAEYQAQIFSNSEFRSIGTLKDDSFATEMTSQPTPDRLVSLMFFLDEHFDYDVPRGPFRSSHDWLEASIAMILKDQAREIIEAEDEEDRKDAERNLRVAQMLADLLPKIFPCIQHPPERTVLWHDDLSLQNIMVDDKGTITAVIDWECVSAMPQWFAAQMPEFLNGTTREEEPQRDSYADEDPENVEVWGHNDLDDEGKTDLYWIHLMEYEKTQLRKVYSKHMSRVWTGWDEAVADSALKADFHLAVGYCDGGYCLKSIAAWVDAINRGEFPRLLETIYPDGLYP